MKPSAVYPSLIVRICCPYCGATGRIKRQQLSEPDFTVHCPHCAEAVLVKTNRRSCYRKSALIPVSYSPFDIDRLDDQRARNGRIIDISRRGMAVRSNSLNWSQHYGSGVFLTFLFSLPFVNDVKKIRAEIVRVTEYDEGNLRRVGVKFSNLDEYTDNAIRFFLSLSP
jgi:c-di-GMP-binding flagellar brake protein YcgR